MDRLFFYLLLSLLPTQLGIHFWPEWTLVLGRRVDYLSPTLYLTDILVFLTLLFWRPKKVPNLLFILGFALLNILFASSHWVALYKWTKIFEFTLLGFYIYRTKPSFSSILVSLSIGALYSSLIAITQFVLGHSVGLWILGERTFTNTTPGIAQYNLCLSPTNCRLVLRSYATFPHPNVLGGFLAVILPLAIREFVKGKKLFYGAVTTLGTIALVITFSRSAWVAALAGVIILYRKRLLFLLVPLIVLAGLLVNVQDESFVVRQELNTAAVSMFLHSPFVGVGLGNFLTELPKTLVSRTIYFLQPVHNIYLLLLSETGLVGFAVFIWILRKVKSITAYSLYLLLFLGLIDHYSFTLQQGQLLFTILLAASTIGS